MSTLHAVISCAHQTTCLASKTALLLCFPTRLARALLCLGSKLAVNVKEARRFAELQRVYKNATGQKTSNKYLWCYSKFFHGRSQAAQDDSSARTAAQSRTMDLGPSTGRSMILKVGSWSLRQAQLWGHLLKAWIQGCELRTRKFFNSYVPSNEEYRVEALHRTILAKSSNNQTVIPSNLS